MDKTRLCLIFVFLSSSFLIDTGKGENILFFHAISTYSHRISDWPLVQKLVEKGHQITFISPYPPKSPLKNVTEIHPEPVSSFVLEYIHGDLDISRRVSGTLDRMQNNAPFVGKTTCEMLFQSEEIKKWLESDPHYDLVVIDWFVSECALGLAHKFKAKTIFFACSVMIPHFYELFGVVPDTASVPEFDYHYKTPMTLWQRLVNTLQPLVWSYKISSYYDSITTTLRDKLNMPDMPHVKELAKNASLILWNESVLDGYPVPITPNFVRVAGMHCQEKINPLPKDLSDFVEKSKDGFVYISLGSGVNPNNLPKSFQQLFFNTIRKFSNIQFLWRWKDCVRKDLPSNLQVGEWFPQQDILGHPKLLAFVSQGGKPSMQEAVCHGAPVLALPVMADQDYNSHRIEEHGGAIVLQFESLTESILQNAIKEITSNAKYKDQMLKVSKLFHDNPMKPADTALWWTEYVLRHSSTAHLKSMSINLPWYQRRLLDVWGLLFVVAATSMAFAAYLIKYLVDVFTRDTKLKNE